MNQIKAKGSTTKETIPETLLGWVIRWSLPKLFANTNHVFFVGRAELIDRSESLVTKNFQYNCSSFSELRRGMGTCAQLPPNARQALFPIFEPQNLWIDKF